MREGVFSYEWKREQLIVNEKRSINDKSTKLWHEFFCTSYNCKLQLWTYSTMLLFLRISYEWGREFLVTFKGSDHDNNDDNTADDMLMMLLMMMLMMMMMKLMTILPRLVMWVEVLWNSDIRNEWRLWDETKIVNVKCEVTFSFLLSSGRL